MSTTTAEAINVLLVEDDLVDAKWVQRALDTRNQGGSYPISLEHVDRLEKALQRLKGNNIQMILLDLGLPDTVTYTESVERIHESAPDIPIVVLSGNSYESTGPVVLEKGALYFFPKNGAEAEALCRTIQVTLEKHRLQANLRRMIEQSVDGMLIVDEEDNVLFSNPAARNLLSLDPVRPAIFEYQREKGEIVESRLPGDRTVEVQTVDLEWNGQPASLVTLRDVTQRKKLENQLQQAQKMEAVGMLAGGVAHDFNNILTVISGYADVLLETIDTSDPAYSDLTEISRAAARGSSVTRQLLTFSRQEVTEPRSLNLNDVVSNIDKLLHRVIGANIELRLKLDQDIWNIKADPGHIEQMIVNLAINARDAMPEGGLLRIETAMIDVDEVTARKRLPVREPGRYAMLTVSDTGEGISKDVLPHVFEPFYTTKGVGKGSGLGLAMVYGVVEQSGGTIWVHSEPGMGASFDIYFPVEDRGSASDNEQPPVAVEKGSERLLLVEDEVSVREYAARVLRSWGYEVFEAGSGREALEVIVGLEPGIDLLVTDVIMPGMTGPELADRLLERRPDLPVVYMSGYTRDSVIRRGVKDGDMRFLQKPFGATELVARIRDVLDEPT